jgi:hypothetical protein
MIINLTIPADAIVSNELTNFSPEENYLMLKIGCECLMEGRKMVAGLTQKEIYNKIKQESIAQTNKLELDVLTEKELSKKMEDRTKKIYEGQIEKLERQIEIILNQLDNSKRQLKVYESENNEIIQQKINAEKDNYELLLKEKDKQNQLNRESFDKAMSLFNKNVYKSSKEKGDCGEDVFNYLSNTFKDFGGYKIENKSKQGHKGDFHLFFHEFNVLVDSKNYASHLNVQKKEVSKIEQDLIANNNMKFAWLIALDSDICEWNRFPIMNKWIMTDSGMKCIIFVNNLLDNKDPQNVLKLVWSICNEFNKLIKENDSDDDKLKFYIDRDLLLHQKIKQLQERSGEMRRNINCSSKILKDIENDIIELLLLISNEILENETKKYNLINEWWDNNIEYTDDDCKLISTEIWNKFKKENKEYISEKNIRVETFKDIIIKNVNSSKYIEKTKKGSIEFIGIKFKVDSSILHEGLVVDLETSNIQNLKNKKDKIKNESKYYFDERKDNKILEEYTNTNNNIMHISESNNIRPWEVVSLLMQYKIITKRDDSRGYNIYKETDEYKQKIIKK